MSWATAYIKQLEEGKTVSFRPYGNSMSPLIESGELVTVEPILFDEELHVGSIVLCTVGKHQYLHRIINIDETSTNCGRLYQIGNNKGGINGWIDIDKIYGILIK